MRRLSFDSFVTLSSAMETFSGEVGQFQRKGSGRSSPPVHPTCGLVRRPRRVLIGRLLAGASKEFLPTWHATELRFELLTTSLVEIAVSVRAPSANPSRHTGPPARLAD